MLAEHCYGGLFFFAVVLHSSATAEQRGNYGWEHHQAELRRVKIGGMLFDEKGELANELHGRKCAIIIKGITGEECRLEFADRNGLVQAIFEARVGSRRIQRMPGNISETESQARCGADRWVAALSKTDNKARLAPGSRHYCVVVFNEGGDERYLFGREGYSARTASALVCLFVCLFVLTTPGMPVVALLPLRRLSQDATQSIPGLRLKKLGAALPLALW